MLPNKTERIYLKLFNLLTDFTVPKNVTLDFEKACLNALLTVWPDVILLLCWFHYAQNFWKNMQLKKLVIDYAQNELVRKLYNYIIDCMNKRI